MAPPAPRHGTNAIAGARDAIGHGSTEFHDRAHMTGRQEFI